MGQDVSRVLIELPVKILRAQFTDIIHTKCIPEFDKWLGYSEGGDKSRMELWIGETEAKWLYYDDFPKVWLVCDSCIGENDRPSWKRLENAGKAFLATFLAESRKLASVMYIGTQNNTVTPTIRAVSKVTPTTGGRYIRLEFGFEFHVYIGIEGRRRQHLCQIDRQRCDSFLVRARRLPLRSH